MEVLVLILIRDLLVATTRGGFAFILILLQRASKELVLEVEGIGVDDNGGIPGFLRVELRVVLVLELELFLENVPEVDVVFVGKHGVPEALVLGSTDFFNGVSDQLRVGRAKSKLFVVETLLAEFCIVLQKFGELFVVEERAVELLIVRINAQMQNALENLAENVVERTGQDECLDSRENPAV